MKKLLFILLLSVSATLSSATTVENVSSQKRERTYYEQAKPEKVSSMKVQDVSFTSYWDGDETGSGDSTGSGLNSLDFEVNEKGWYTYQNKVVVATATYECMNSNTGACSQYNKVPEGYHVMNYFDEMVIIVDDVPYLAVVLDSCGASFWAEERQRVDIYVSSEESAVGKVYGSIKYK